jgi:hypothetical protein
MRECIISCSSKFVASFLKTKKHSSRVCYRVTSFVFTEMKLKDGLGNVKMLAWMNILGEMLINVFQDIFSGRYKQSVPNTGCFKKSFIVVFQMLLCGVYTYYNEPGLKEAQCNLCIMHI